MLTKSIPHFTKEINGRIVKGVFAVNGNIDSGGDMTVNGAFTKGLEDGNRDRVRFLWNHDSWTPPIASIKEIYEVDRSGLPQKVRDFAPMATGGAIVVREYHKGIDLSDWVLANLEAGSVDEMSYAYDITDSEQKTTEDGDHYLKINGVVLYDVSDVNWGMNNSTSGVMKSQKGLPDGSGLTFLEHGETIESSIMSFVKRVQENKAGREKAGRVLSDANWQRIKSLLDNLELITDDMRSLLQETTAEPKTENVQDIRRLLMDIERTKFKTARILQNE